ncbi:hypothetical protein M9Y10_033148 [Tritrichomonas musculus]|uniref:Uncharacterized protein n=1 Tax=Tritrichomonas musculus TaxID=1915356 RepID=A0ABR2GZ50_9EUKA
MRIFLFKLQRTKNRFFPENSELHSIDKFAFVLSSVESFTLPQKVENLADGWCFMTPNLHSIMISPNNRLLALQDDERKMLFGKSKSSLDVLILACHDFRRAVIPSLTNVEFLGDNLTVDVSLFENCERLVLVSFPNSTNIKVNRADLDLASGEMSLFVSPNTILKTGF